MHNNPRATICIENYALMVFEALFDRVDICTW
jgi:hypothetical protein